MSTDIIPDLKTYFSYNGCSYNFDKIDIYHCLEDDSRYVIGLFSYNKANDRFIKFRHRRNKDGSWGSILGIRFEPFMQYRFKRHDYDLKKGSFNVGVKEVYEEQVENANAIRIVNGMRKIIPLDYNEESYDAQRVIIGHTFQTLKQYYGPNGVEISTQELLKAHTKAHPTKLPEELPEEFVETASSTSVSFSVVCLDCIGYEDHFVNGEVYSATQSDGEMLVVESDDGTTHRMFADRFKRV